MKKTIVAILITVLLLSTMVTAYALSEDSNNDEGSIGLTNNKTPEILELSLIEAINHALEHSRDIKIQDIEIESSELNYEQNKRSIKDFRKSVEDYEELSDSNKELLRLLGADSGIPVIDKKLLELGVLIRHADLSLQIANWNKDIKINEIKYNVEKGYFNLSQVQKELEIANEGLELAKKQYEQSKLMYNLGTISQQQLVAIELGVSQAQVGVDGATMAYELQKMNFNNTLGLSLNQKVLLTDSIEYKEHEEIVLEDSVKEALNTNISLTVANENYELSKLTLEATKARYPENTYKYREQAIVVETAAKNLETAKTGIEMGVRSAYLGLTTSEKQIATYELTVQQAEKALELAQISFELGQNTATEVNQAMIELMTAKKNLSKQIHAYNLALLDFKYSIGLGKTQIPAGY